MLGNLAAKLILENDINDFEFNDGISKYLKILKKTKNKTIKKNGVLALAIFSEKLDAKIKIPNILNITSEFLRDIIIFDDDIDNLMNSLTFLEKNFATMDSQILKNKEFITKIMAFLRFFK